MKLVRTAMCAMAIAACAAEPAIEQETPVMAQAIDESHHGGVADCGTKDTPPCPLDAVSPPGGPPQCGTIDTPQCPATEWQTCGTKDTPPCPSSGAHQAPAASPGGGR